MLKRTLIQPLHDKIHGESSAGPKARLNFQKAKVTTRPKAGLNFFKILTTTGNTPNTNQHKTTPYLLHVKENRGASAAK
jgi:hypothetical protein